VDSTKNSGKSLNYTRPGEGGGNVKYRWPLHQHGDEKRKDPGQGSSPLETRREIQPEKKVATVQDLGEIKTAGLVLMKLLEEVSARNKSGKSA